METLFKVNVEQVGVVAKSYVTLLLARIQEAQSLMNQFGRDDFFIEIEGVLGDGVGYGCGIGLKIGGRTSNHHRGTACLANKHVVFREEGRQNHNFIPFA